MTKSTKRSLAKGWTINPQQARAWLDKAGLQIARQDYSGAVQTCKRILQYAPRNDPLRADVLGYLGTAYSMLQKFDRAFKTYTEALSITPNDPALWYNRAGACLYTMRTGQAVRDLERAAQVDTKGEFKGEIGEKLKFCQKIAKQELALRGPDFTLDQLIEQQELFCQGVGLMEAERLEEAAEAFRKVIAMGECLPQPWGNLGVCLLMLGRYGEAEAALKLINRN